jgi:hypothetical protein
VKFQRIGDLPADAPPPRDLSSAVFVDDGHPSVQVRNWTSCAPSDFLRHFDNGCRQSTGLRADGFVKFPLSGTTRGTRYDVYATWLERGDLSSKVTFRIKIGRNVFHELRVDQTLPPTNLFFGRSWADPGARDVGVPWRLIGSFISDGSAAELSVMSPGRDQLAVADGVMIIPSDGANAGPANFAFPRPDAFKNVGRSLVRLATANRAFYLFTKGLPLLQSPQRVWTLDGLVPNATNLPVVGAQSMLVGAGGDVQLMQAAPRSGVYIFRLELQGLGNQTTHERLAVLPSRNGTVFGDPLLVDSAGGVNGYFFVPLASGEQAGLQISRSEQSGDARIRFKISGAFGR